MHTPVSFELAKLLKEKGFDKKTLQHYNPKNILKFKSSEGVRITSAPTIAEVVMWLYEKYGVWINVECDCCGELWFFSIKSASKTTWEDLDKRYVLSSWNREVKNESKSPKEAYEKAIIYLLKQNI